MKRIVLLALFVSCAHKPLSYDKTKLVEIKKDDTHFYLLQNYRPTPHSGRTLASVQEVKNNREFYFTALFHQYQELASLAKENNQLKSCPAFHQIWVDLQNKSYPKQLVLDHSYKDIVHHEHSLAIFPELALKAKNGRSLASVIEKSYDDEDEVVLTREVIANYNERNLKELHTLCDTGLSSNYYVFENMISFYSQNHAKHSAEVFKAYMKMPIMTNFLLMERFSKGTDQFAHTKMKDQTFNMLGASSFHGYLDNLSSLRNNFRKISYKASRE